MVHGDDLTVTRFPGESSRVGGISTEMRVYPTGSNSPSLIDVNMGGGACFAWSNHWSIPLMFKIERFLLLKRSIFSCIVVSLPS